MRDLVKHLITVILSVALAPIIASAANVDVCSSCTYHTIGDAISAAQSGDTIRIATGTYEENVSINGTKSLRLEGGYNSDFTLRNVDTFPAILTSVNVSYYNSGDEVLDGLTIAGAQSAGILAWSPNSTLTVTNCRIHDNTSSGIYVLTIKAITIVNNVLWSNYDPTGSYFTAAIYISDNLHSRAEIADNSIIGSVCKYCYGIIFTNASSNDIVARNVVQGNSAGMSISASSGTVSPLVEWNDVNSNVSDGISISGGASIVRHNLVYDNGGVGIMVSSPADATIVHNVSARNGRQGLLLTGWLQGSIQPVVRNNIFYANANGLYISGGGGWGSTNIYPVSEYNAFFANTYSEMVHSGVYPWGFEDETPGAYGELNAPSWSKHNLRHNPGFADEEHGDFSLRADSFLIDAGSPDDPFVHEPTPNGDRVNISMYGDTVQAETSPAAPQISNLSAWITGNDVMLSFDTNTSTVSNWLNLEYNTGSGFVSVAPSAIIGDQVVQGYKGARITTGIGRLITWQGGTAHLPIDESEKLVRLTVQRGDDSASATVAICSTCASIYEELPEPTQNVEPTPTPSSAPSSTPTVVPTHTPLATPNATYTPTVTPTPTPIETPVLTVTPDTTLTTIPRVITKPRRTATPTPTAKPRPKKRQKPHRSGRNS